MGEILDRIKNAFRDTAEKAADSAKIADPKNYKGSNDLNEKRNYEKGRKEPMNREDIAEGEPTAVKRDKSQGDAGDLV